MSSCQDQVEKKCWISDFKHTSACVAGGMNTASDKLSIGDRAAENIKRIRTSRRWIDSQSAFAT
eukprot:2904858-Amphidinium_carterae.1